MTTRNINTDRTILTPSGAARWAGAGYVAIFILAIAANFGVRSRLVSEDHAVTMTNIADNATAFRWGIAAFIAIAVIDIFIAWMLHVSLRATGETRSLLAAWLRLGYSFMLAAATTFMVLALHTATSPASIDALDDAQRAWSTGLAMEAFDVAWLIALAVFGLHLIVIGWILVGTRLAPRALGFTLAIAGGAYILDTFAHVLMANYATYADAMLAVVAVPSMVAELWFAGWLLTRAPRAVVILPGQESAPVAA